MKQTVVSTIDQSHLIAIYYLIPHIYRYSLYFVTMSGPAFESCQFGIYAVRSMLVLRYGSVG